MENNLYDWCILHEYNEILDEWDYIKNFAAGLDIHNVAKSSNKKAYWKCKNDHSYISRISHRTNGHKCPYCSGLKLLIGYNDLETLAILEHNEKFLEDWDYELNELNPNKLENQAKKLLILGVTYVDIDGQKK